VLYTNGLSYLTNEPAFLASVAYRITAGDTGNWSNAGTLAHTNNTDLYLSTPVSTGVLYVDGGRGDTYVANGTITRPYKTISAAESNASNVTTIWIIRKSSHYNEPGLVISNACNIRGQGEPIIDGPVIFKGNSKTISSVQFNGNVICSNIFISFTGGEIVGTVYIGSTNTAHAVRLDGTYVHPASGPAIALSGAAGLALNDANCTAVGDMSSSALSCTGSGLVSVVNSLAMNMAAAPTIYLAGGQLVGSQNLVYNLGYGTPFFGSAISATNALLSAPNLVSDTTCMGGLVFGNSLTVVDGATLTIPGTTISGTLVSYRPASRLSNDSVVNGGVGTVRDALNVLYTNGLSYLTNEPAFLASVAYRITAGDTNNWSTAFSWGNHALMNYLTNGQAGIYFSGTTALSNAVVRGAQTNYGIAVFEGLVRLTNNAIAWDDMLSSANSAYQSGATDISTDDALGGKSFATSATTNAANDHLTFTFQTPHRRKSGTSLKPHIHFWQTNADQTNCWYAYYSFAAPGQTNSVEVQVGPASNELAYAGGTLHQLASFPDIDGTGKGISSILRYKLYRFGSRGTGSITVTDLDCHYQVDGFGSDTPTAKSY